MRKQPQQHIILYNSIRNNQIEALTSEFSSEINNSLLLPKIDLRAVKQQAAKQLNYQYRAKESNIKQNLGNLTIQLAKLKRKMEKLENKKKNLEIDRPFDERYVNRFIDLSNFASGDNYNKLCNHQHHRCIPRKCQHQSQPRNTVNSQIHRQLMNQGQKRHKHESFNMQNSPLALSNKEVFKKKDTNLNQSQCSQQFQKKGQFIKYKNSNSNPKIQKKSGRKLIRLFRIKAYAIYFTFFLASFSKKIYKYRLRQFMAEYPHEVNKYYSQPQPNSKFKKDEAKLWKFMKSKLDILYSISQEQNLSNLTKGGKQVKQIKQYFQFIINQELDTSKKILKPQLPYSEELMFPKNQKYLLAGFETIIFQIIDKLAIFVTTDTFFAENWKTFGQGVCNNCFINNSHPKLPSKVVDSGIVKLHKYKEILLVEDINAQAILLSIDLLCRLFAYKWMVKLQKLKKADGPQEQNSIIASLLLTVLYLIGEKMLDELISNYKQNDTSNKQRSSKHHSIRPIIPLLVSQGHRRDQNLVKSVNIISNPPLFQQATTFIASNPQFSDKLSNKMKNFGSQVCQHLKQLMKDDKIKVKEKVLSQYGQAVIKKISMINSSVQLKQFDKLLININKKKNNIKIK